MKALILGSGGRLGTLLQAAWPKDGQTTPIWRDRAALDIIGDAPALQQACAAADAIILLAGTTSEVTGKSFDDNVTLAEATLEAAGRKRVLLASTAAVYGALPGPLLESHKGAPVSPYGISKQRMEAAAAAYPNATCMRIGNVAGADALLGASRLHYRVHQFAGGGFVTRSYIGPTMLAQAVAALCLAETPPPIINVALPNPVAMTDLLDAAGKSWAAEPAPPSALEQVKLDTALLHSIFPIDPAQSSARAIVNDLQSVIGVQA